MKKIFNCFLFPFILILLSFSFYSLGDDVPPAGESSALQNNLIQNDSFKITSLFSKGEVPYPAGVPDTIEAIFKSDIPNTDVKRAIVMVYNNGTVLCDPLINLDPSCFSGAPKILEEKELKNIGAFEESVKFDITNYGLKANDLVIVSAVKGKGYINANTDFKTYCYKVTADGWNHIDSCKPKVPGSVFSGRPGNIVAGFRNQSQSEVYIGSVEHTFYDTLGSGLKPYRVVLYGDNGSSKPGSLLHLSSALTSPAGSNSPQTVTYNLSSPVTVLPGKMFFAGLRQTSNSNIKAAFQSEVPVRKNAFYFSSPDTGGTWYDFSDSSKNLVMDISPKILPGFNLTSLVEGFFNGSTMIQDTMRIYVRNNTAPYALVDSAKVYLGSNGFGNSSFSNITGGIPYYLQLKHRNSLSTWSAAPQTFTSGNLTYNFTTSAAKAYGKNMKLKGSRYCIYSGDVNNDGVVDLTDVITVENSANVFSTGYLVTDLNGNSIVDLTDVLICYNNSIEFISAITP